MNAARSTGTSATFPRHLVREDLLDFTGYSSARTSAPGGGEPRIWLNANESADRSSVDEEGRCRRYPEPQPPDLVEAFADVWATSPDRVVVGVATTSPDRRPDPHPLVHDRTPPGPCLIPPPAADATPCWPYW